MKNVKQSKRQIQLLVLRPNKLTKTTVTDGNTESQAFVFGQGFKVI